MMYDFLHFCTFRPLNLVTSFSTEKKFLAIMKKYVKFLQLFSLQGNETCSLHDAKSNGSHLMIINGFIITALFSNYTMQSAEEREKSNLVKRAPAVLSHVVVSFALGQAGGGVIGWS